MQHPFLAGVAAATDAAGNGTVVESAHSGAAAVPPSTASPP